MVKIETRCRIPIWQTFGRIQWHVIPEPHATWPTLQGVRIPSTILKIVFRHILFFVLFLMHAVEALTSGGFRIVSDTLVYNYHAEIQGTINRIEVAFNVSLTRNSATVGTRGLGA